MKYPTAIFAMAGLAVTLAAAPADAQKSKDTLRHAQLRGIASLDQWIDPRPEVQFNAEAAYDSLLGFDDANKRYVGVLAKTWKRIDPRTLEFELHDNVTWTDGEKFDADDVVYTFGWILAKTTKLRFKRAYTWIDRIEKLGPHKIRVVSKRPIPWDLARLASQTYILPQHVHGPMKNKRDFGRKPVGTGPYKFTQVDKSKGLIAIKRSSYPQASRAKPAPTIGKLVVMTIPDTGTQIAQLLAGNLDIARDIPGDQAESLAKNPNFRLALRESQGTQYLLIDAKGRSGVKPLTNAKVREAIMKALDVGGYHKVIYGSAIAAKLKRPTSICSGRQIGCNQSVPMAKQDIAGAKKLLAEAGYPNGFDVAITARRGSGLQTAQVMAGQLRAVGIRATISIETFASYRKKQRDGKLQLLVSAYGGGGLPDVAQTLNFFFSNDPRDYHGVPNLIALAKSANSQMDPAKRNASVRQLLDQITTMHYLVPLSPTSNVYIHSKDVKLQDGRPAIGYGFTMSEVSWR